MASDTRDNAVVLFLDLQVHNVKASRTARE
jgi:hypothetical protein